MKKFILILFFIVTTVIAGATDYYVATYALGGRDTNPGTIGLPWLTLKYACDHATVSGDIIHIGVGTFNSGTDGPCNLAVGVSIAGVGVTSVIVTGYRGDGTEHDGFINIESGIEGSAGGQSVHDLKFDGQYSGVSDVITDVIDPATAGGKTAITVHCRENVEIYNCTFQNFWHSAVVFYGGLASWSQNPVVEGTYAEGNSYHDNISTNCSYYTNNNHNTGHLWIQGQKDLLIYNNTMTQTARNAGYNGMCIKGVEGFFKGMKIYNDTLIQNTTNLEVGFSMELWYVRGGCEIYNNTISLCVDIARGIVKSTYDFSIKVYDNTIGQTAYPAGSSPSGVLLERDVQYVYIYNNLIKNVEEGVTLSSAITSTFERIYIYYNILQDMSGTGDAIGMWYSEPGQTVTYTDIYILNNVIFGKVGGILYSGICLPSYGIVTNFYIKNNIIMTNSTGVPIRGVQPACVVDNLDIMNNIFYACGNANLPSLLGNYTLETNYTYSGNITSSSNPYFISTTAPFDFHLQEISPALNAGLDVDLTTDYDGVAVSATTPEIGAYEYVAPGGATTPAVTTTVITDVMGTSATGGGIVTDDGGAVVTVRGVCWDTTTDPTTADDKTEDGTGTGVFESSITGLAEVTFYYVRAYATNSEGTSYGDNVTLTSGPPSIPHVLTILPSVTSLTTATGRGNVTSAGGGTVTDRGVCWGYMENPDIIGNHSHADTGGTGIFTAPITGLTTGIYYHIRSFATNETGTAYGDDILFIVRVPVILRISGGNYLKSTSGKYLRKME